MADFFLGGTVSLSHHFCNSSNQFSENVLLG